MSQLELEVAIDASPGSISRIESGKVNPSKETLQKIASSLDLNSMEIALLFDINSKDFADLVNISNELTRSLIYREIVERAVDIISNKIDLLGITVNKVDEKYTYGVTYTHKKYRDICDRILNKPFDTYKVPREYTEHISNRVAKERIPIVFKDFREYSIHTVSAPVSKILEKVIGFKSGISFPMFYEDEVIGTVQYAQDFETDFSDIYSLLEAFTKNIEVAICNAMKFEELIGKLSSNVVLQTDQSYVEN